MDKRKKFLASFLLTTVIFSVCQFIPFLVRTQASGQHRPFPDYHVTPLNRILYPRIGSPYLKTPNDNFTVYLSCVTDDFPVGYPIENILWNGCLQSIYAAGYEYELEVYDREYRPAESMWLLNFKVPSGVPRELYNLTLYSGVRNYTEPNSVYVDERGFDRPLNIIIFSDSHLRFPPIVERDRLNSLVTQAVVNLSNALDFDVLLHCGDFVDAVTDEKEFERCYRWLMLIRHPFFLTTGNTDSFTIEKGFYYWEKYFSPLYASREVGPYLFISMDSAGGKITDEQIDWVVEDLSVHNGSAQKVILLHHHFWLLDEVSPNFYDRMPGVLWDYNVTLMLMGHWHFDHVYMPIESPNTVCITTTSTAASDQYRGFRTITLNSTEVIYRNQSIRFTDLNVTYLQRNDGSSPALAILTQNDLNEDVTLKLPILLLKTDDPLTVENATLTKDISYGNKRVLEVNLTLLPGQERLVKVYGVQDTQPPSIEIIPEVKNTTVTLHFQTSDVGLGVLQVNFFFSDDNTTWTRITPPAFINYFPFLQFEATNRYRMYYKAEVMDAAYHITTTYGSVRFPPESVVLDIPTEVTRSSLMLSWTESNDEDFERYEIYKSTTSGNLGDLVSNITNRLMTSYKITGLSSKTTYYFTIRVVDTDNLHTNSSQVSVTTKSTVFLWIGVPLFGVAAAAIILFMRGRKVIKRES